MQDVRPLGLQLTLRFARAHALVPAPAAVQIGRKPSASQALKAPSRAAGRLYPALSVYSRHHAHDNPTAEPQCLNHPLPLSLSQPTNLMRYAMHTEAARPRPALQCTYTVPPGDPHARTARSGIPQQSFMSRHVCMLGCCDTLISCHRMRRILRKQGRWRWHQARAYLHAAPPRERPPPNDHLPIPPASQPYSYPGDTSLPTRAHLPIQPY